MKKWVMIVICAVLLIGCNMEENGVEENVGLEIKTEIYEQGDIVIQYPQIDGMEDEEREKEINELIQNHALEMGYFEPEKFITEDGTLVEDQLEKQMEYEITFLSGHMISILYQGEVTRYLVRNGVRDGWRFGYCMDGLTIDLDEVKELELSDFVEIDENFVKKIKESTDILIAGGKVDFSQDRKESLIEYDSDELLIEAFTEKWEGYDFCVAPDELIISVGIGSAAGDYALVKIPNCCKPIDRNWAEMELPELILTETQIFPQESILPEPSENLELLDYLGLSPAEGIWDLDLTYIDDEDESLDLSKEAVYGGRKDTASFFMSFNQDKLKDIWLAANPDAQPGVCSLAGCDMTESRETAAEIFQDDCQSVGVNDNLYASSLRLEKMGVLELGLTCSGSGELNFIGTEVAPEKIEELRDWEYLWTEKQISFFKPENNARVKIRVPQIEIPVDNALSENLNQIFMEGVNRSLSQHGWNIDDIEQWRDASIDIGYEKAFESAEYISIHYTGTISTDDRDYNLDFGTTCHTWDGGGMLELSSLYSKSILDQYRGAHGLFGIYPNHEEAMQDFAGKEEHYTDYYLMPETLVLLGDVKTEHAVSSVEAKEIEYDTASLLREDITWIWDSYYYSQDDRNVHAAVCVPQIEACRQIDLKNTINEQIVNAVFGQLRNCGLDMDERENWKDVKISLDGDCVYIGENARSYRMAGELASGEEELELLFEISIDMDGKVTWRTYAGVPSGELGYQLSKATLSRNDSHIEYPQFCGMDDPDAEYSLNRMIEAFIIEKSGIMKEMETFLFPDGTTWTDVLTVDFNYEITLHTPEIISILFRGNEDFQSSPVDHYKNQDIYGITIDIERQTELGIEDFVSLDNELLEKIKKAPAISAFNEELSEEDKRINLDMIISIDENRILEGLKNEEFCYAYCLSEDALIIAVPVAHAGGDYMLLNVSCE